MSQRIRKALFKFKGRSLALKIALSFVVMFFYSISGYAQNASFTIKGKITDSKTGEPIFGASVMVKGTSKGTSADLDGWYTLENISSQDILRFSYLGFETKENQVGNLSELNISLESSTSDLNEFVVIGYGVQERRNLTGAVVSIGSDEISKTNFQDPISVLQGRAAGVQVTSNSGAPGGGMTLTLEATPP